LLTNFVATNFVRCLSSHHRENDDSSLLVLGGGYKPPLETMGLLPGGADASNGRAAAGIKK